MQAAMTDLDTARRAWADALVQRDVDALAELLDDGVVYVHSTGIVHDRRAYLDYVRTGPRFLAVEMHDASLRLRGAVAIINGVLHLRLQRAGETARTQLTALATQAWFHDNDAWRLATAHTTRPAVAAPNPTTTPA